MVIKPSTATSGLTLIELLITIAVMAVLLAIAYPTYITQVQKARRADAQGAILENAQFMQRLYTETGCYNPGADRDCAPPNNDAGATLPITESPVDGGTKYYTHSVQNLTAMSYTLRAVPKGAQSDDHCGTMTLNHVRQKTPSDPRCWRK